MLFLILLPQRIQKSIMAIPREQLQIYVGLAAAGNLPCIDSYESFIAEVYTEPKPLPKSGKSEVASETTPEVSAPIMQMRK